MQRATRILSRGIAYLLLATCLAILARPKPAWSMDCPRSQLDAASSAVSNLKNWKQVHLFFTKFGSCDDGGTADDVSESVVRLFVDQWEELKLFALEIKNDQGFEKFVLTHVDSTANTDDLEKIRAYSKQRCPTGLTDLCKQIGDAARTALQ
jgi:hypothetical protein